MRPGARSRTNRRQSLLEAIIGISLLFIFTSHLNGQKVLWAARVSVCFCSRVGLWSLAREWVREPRGNDDQTDSDESQLWVRGRGRSICQVVLHKSSFDLNIGAEYLPKPLNTLNVLLGDWWLYEVCESETCCCLAALSHLNCTSTLVREGVNFPCYGQYDTSYYD